MNVIQLLRRGEVAEVGGIKFKMDVDQSGNEKPVQRGDLYVAQRNAGPHLLEAARVVAGWIEPTTLDYSFDLADCVKIIEAA